MALFADSIQIVDLKESPKLILILVMLLGMALAVWAGTLIGNADYFPLLVALVAVAGAIFLGTMFRHLLALGFALAILDLWMAPAGFKISAMEQTGVLALAFWIMIFWRSDFNPNAPSEFRNLSSYGFFRFMVIASVCYAVIHFFFNMNSPYDELAFGWKGALKSYLQVFGPFLMVTTLMDARLFGAVSSKGSVKLLKVFYIFLSISLAIKLVTIIRFGAIPESDGMSFEEKGELARSFFIPVLNIWDNIYTLRALGPAGALLGATFYFCGKGHKVLSLLIMLTGLAGSAMSGGRAALLFALTFIGLAMFRSGRKGTIFAWVGFLAVSCAIMFVMPVEILRKAPFHVQRSIGMIRTDIDSSATQGIEGSSDMRKDYFNYAWDYWSHGDARLILTGRSVGQMDQSDMTSFLSYDEAAKMFFAVRRLATHNGLTDLLLGWGVIGYAFVITTWIACLVMLHKYNGRFTKGSQGDCWLFASKVFFCFYIIYMHIGGSFIWPLNVWFILIALTQVDGLKKSFSSGTEERIEELPAAVTK